MCETLNLWNGPSGACDGPSWITRKRRMMYADNMLVRVWAAINVHPKYYPSPPNRCCKRVSFSSVSWDFNWFVCFCSFTHHRLQVRPTLLIFNYITGWWRCTSDDPAYAISLIKQTSGSGPLVDFDPGTPTWEDLYRPRPVSEIIVLIFSNYVSLFLLNGTSCFFRRTPGCPLL